MAKLGVWIGILGIIAIGALLFMLMKPEAIKPAANITSTQNITENVSMEDKAEFGDLITINYALYFENGTVADTNNETLAQEVNLKNYVKAEHILVLGQSGKIPSFDRAIVGMKEGEYRETILQPTEKELYLRINKTKSINRFIPVTRAQRFPMKRYKDFFKKPPVINDVVFNEKFPWKYQVVNFTNETVLTNIYVKENETFIIPGTQWKSKVFQVYENIIVFYQMPQENQTIDTDYGPAVINMTKSRIYVHYQPKLYEVLTKPVKLAAGYSVSEQFQVVEVTDKDFLLKRVGLLADKRLKMDVELLSLTKEVKTVAEKPHVLKEVVGAQAN